MRIVVNHLTRMRSGYVCVAGLDPEEGRHVRPVLAEGALPFDLLARYGGPFEMAAVVDLGSPRAAKHTPHVEDRVIATNRLRTADAALNPMEFWKLLSDVSKARLGDIFGPHLKRVGAASCGTDEGRGKASLGCFRPITPPRLYTAERGASGKPAIRIHVCDDQFDVVLGVTDLRLYEDDHVTPDLAVIRRVAQRVEIADNVLLGVGLTRAFATSSEPDSPAYHWAQVTNLHLRDDPTWALG